MATGPGKYDDITERVRVETGAQGVLLLIFGGNRGTGFSVTTTEYPHQSFMEQIPAVLREVAGKIEADLKPKGSA